MKPSRFLSPAEEELYEAAAFYESRAHNLGIKFISTIEKAVEDIETNPERWPVIKHNIRRRLVARFPYAVLYKNDPDEIVIIAIMHLHRKPNYWIDRV